MKHIIVALALVFSLHMTAQENEKHSEHEMTKREMRHHKKGKKMFKDMSPEQIATLKTKKMTLALDLSENQQQRLLALNTQTAKERKTKMETRKAQMEKKEKLSSDEKFALMNEKLDAEIAYQKSIKQILTDTQFEKWKKMKAHRGKRKHKGKGKKSQRQR